MPDIPTIVTTVDEGIPIRAPPASPPVCLTSPPPAHFRSASHRSNNLATPSEQNPFMYPQQTSSYQTPLSPLTPQTTGKAGGHEPQPGPAQFDYNGDTNDPTPFLFRPTQLASLVDPKNLDELIRMGGVDNLVKGLGSDRTKGLPYDATAPGCPVVPGPGAHGPGAHRFSAQIDERRRVYGQNVLPTPRHRSLLQLMWLAVQDKVLLLLSGAAVISLVVGLVSDLVVKHPPSRCQNSLDINCKKPRVDWVKGAAIVIAVIIVVVVGSLNDWQKERQFQALSDKKADRLVKVIRSGRELFINVKDIVVGDVGVLEPGEIIPCDGIYLKGHNIRCDECSLTGESGFVHKTTYEECLEESKMEPNSPNRDCFLLSGTKVQEGIGEYLVIAVGPKSLYGRTLYAVRPENESSPLQIKMNTLAEHIAIVGSVAGLTLFTTLMIWFFINLAKHPEKTVDEKVTGFVNNLIISITLIVVSVPEGLPLAVSLALAFAAKRMAAKDLLVRALGSCETMASVNVVCIGKTGVLTQNTMTVVAGSIGVHAKFTRQPEGDPSSSRDSDSSLLENGNMHPSDFTLDLEDQDHSLSTTPPNTLLNEAICLSSTAFLSQNSTTGEEEFIGPKIEAALLRFAKDLGWKDYKQVRDTAQVVQTIPFSSERQCSGVVVKNSPTGARLYLKGAPETLTAQCNRHVIVQKSNKTRHSTNRIQTKEINNICRANIDSTIRYYTNKSFRALGICYRDFPLWPPPNLNLKNGAISVDVLLDTLLEDLTLIAIIGVDDPLRPDAAEAVRNCRRAGVTIKVCTGDHALTACSIASQCGIYNHGDIIMEGSTWRGLTLQQKAEVAPRLQVLARASPSDKRSLIETLKALGEVVGTTGKGANDGPALQAASVGFTMGVNGVEVAKDSSDIVLMDESFSSIVSAIKWGRCVVDGIRKFLLFQICVNIAAVLITFVSVVASNNSRPVLTPVQLLWINIIMDSFAALALATGPASSNLLDRKPDRLPPPLFTSDMLKQMLIQPLYQTLVVLSIHFGGDRMFSFDISGKSIMEIEQWHAELRTLAFNTFVFCQIFNSVNCRQVGKHKNVLAGITKNPYFMCIILLEIAIQILIIFVGSAAFSVTRMSARSWAISVALGFVPLPLGFLLRLIPNHVFKAVFIAIGLSTSSPPPTMSPDIEMQNLTSRSPRSGLRTFIHVRGGRVPSEERNPPH